MNGHGDYPNGIPNNLMPYLTQVATDKLDVLSIYEKDCEHRIGHEFVDIYI